MPDVTLTVGADSSEAAAGLAALRNYGKEAASSLTGVFAKNIAVGGLFAGIAEGVKKVTEYATRVDNLSERFAVSRKVIQQWGEVAEQKGSSLDGIASGFNRVEIAQSKAISGNKGILEAFEHLGVSIEDLRNLSADEIVLKIGKSSMDASDMVKIFGKNALELIPTFRAVADGSAPLGKAIDDNLIKKLHDADDQIKQMAPRWRIAFAELAGFLINAYTGLKALGQGIAQPFSAEGRADLKAGKSWANDTLDEGHRSERLAAAQARMDKILTPEAKRLARNLGSGGQGGSAITDAGDIDAGGGSGGGGGYSSAESTRERIAKLEEEAQARARTDQQQLNALLQKKVGLYDTLAQAQGHINGDAADEETQQQALLAVAENNAEIDKLSAKVAKDQQDTQEKITKAREEAAQHAARDLSTSQEQSKELEFQLRGRSDLAERAKLTYDYDQKIKEAQAAIDEAEAQGFNDVAATNRQLVQQLQTEKQTALAAHDKAAAEEKAAAAAKDAAEAATVAKDVGAAQDSLAALRESRAEQVLIEQGHGDIAAKMHDEFAAQTQINGVLDEANEAWAKMDEAYANGSTLLGDQYAELAKINEATAKELDYEKQISAEHKAQAENQARWAHGMQDFADNAASSIAGIQSSAGYKKLAARYGPGAALQSFFPDAAAFKRAERADGTLDFQKLLFDQNPILRTVPQPGIRGAPNYFQGGHYSRNTDPEFAKLLEFYRNAQQDNITRWDELMKMLKGGAPSPGV